MTPTTAADPGSAAHRPAARLHPCGTGRRLADARHQPQPEAGSTTALMACPDDLADHTPPNPNARLPRAHHTAPPATATQLAGECPAGGSYGREPD